jgi:gamma-glutamyl-gamma-aminobutyrate hydrolase PuuD
MTTGDYLAARPPLDESEHVLIDGAVDHGLSKVSVNLEVIAQTEDELIEGLRREVADREIDPDECVGLQGFSESYQAKYPNWKYNSRLGPRIAVIWHPEAIIPPCHVLIDGAVVYGAIAEAGKA